MEQPMYCLTCKGEVIPTKKINWLILALGVLFSFIGAIVYLLYHAFVKLPHCPNCRNKHWGINPRKRK